jgi:hypothetical protein
MIAVGAGVFISLAGPNAGADKAPLQLLPSAESSRVAATLGSRLGRVGLCAPAGHACAGLHHSASTGIVMAAVFCVLAVLPLIVLTQLGVIVGLGILLDTFVVRTVLIPALFTMIGPRIWWPAKVDDAMR